MTEDEAPPPENATRKVEVARFRFTIPIPWGILEELAPELESKESYRVGLVVWQLGWVDLDLESSTILLGQ